MSRSLVCQFLVSCLCWCCPALTFYQVTLDFHSLTFQRHRGRSFRNAHSTQKKQFECIARAVAPHAQLRASRLLHPAAALCIFRNRRTELHCTLIEPKEPFTGLVPGAPMSRTRTSQFPRDLIHVLLSQLNPFPSLVRRALFERTSCGTLPTSDRLCRTSRMTTQLVETILDFSATQQSSHGGNDATFCSHNVERHVIKKKLEFIVSRDLSACSSVNLWVWDFVCGHIAAAKQSPEG